MNSEHARLNIGQKEIMLVLLALTWLLSSTFTAHRLLVFNTAPFDPYLDYVAYLATGGLEGSIPGSPFRERILSVAPAAVLAAVLPAFPLSNAAGVNPALLKASFAVALLNGLTFLLAAILTATAAKRFLFDNRAAVLCGVFVLVCAETIGLTGVDGIGVMTVALLVLLHVRDYRRILLVVLLLSALINEKILIFGAPYLLYFGMSNRRDLLPAAFALLGFAAYLLLRHFYGGGNDEHLRPGEFFASSIATVAVSVTLKGLYLNVLPIFVICIPVLLVWLKKIDGEYMKVAAGACLFAVMVLGMAALVANLQYNLGRVLLYACPASALFVGLIFDSFDTRTRGSAG